MQGAFENLVGQRFGHYIVVRRVENDKNNNARWLCRCDCGNEKEVLANQLKSGHSHHCGCQRGQKIQNKRLYNIWRGMKLRCNCKKSPSYKYYGERGISVCKEWETSSRTFISWALANGYREDLTLDRIDVDGNYCPENCRWATYKEQAKNKRTKLAKST